MLQELFVIKEGYNPLLITPKWQAAQLNYADDLDIKRINFLEMHPNTDETFTLLQGRALLIATNDDASKWEMIWMKEKITYNVPTGVWHGIVLDVDAQVLIFEDANTHLMEKGIRNLSEEEIKNITAKWLEHS